MSLKPLLRDPLLYFFLLGGGCFLAYQLLNGGKHEIAVPLAVQEQLYSDHQLILGRAPSAEERKTLVARYVDDEILFREAVAQNMHASDLKVKERLIDKMRFLLTDAVDDPDDEALVNFYAENHRYYYTEAKYRFEQRYFKQAPADPAAILKALQAGENVSGEEFWLGGQLQAYDESMVRSVLGQPFIVALRAAKPGVWTGPLQSPRGWHYLRVEQIREPELMPFAQIREQVAQDWTSQQHEASIQAHLAELKKKYDVEIEH